MPVTKIRKRDGRIVDFEPSRIKDAIHKAFIAVELADGEKAAELTEETVKLINEGFAERIPSVEDVQDLVIDVLKKRRYERVAAEYEAYRKKKEEIRSLQKNLGIEPKLTVNAMEVLRKRYLLKDLNERIVETPAQMFMRIAKAISNT